MATLALFLPNFFTHRWNLRWNSEPLFRAAPQAASPSAASRNLFPFLIRLFFFLPADRLLPGQIPLQLHKFLAVSNRPISGPISARILAPVISLIPGIVCSSSYCSRYGSSLCFIRSSSSSICRSSNTACSTLCPISHRWCSFIWCLSRASVSSGILCRSFRLASWATCSASSSSPDKRTLTISCPETPNTSLTMLPILTLATSSTFCIRFFSAARLLSSFFLLRVRSRSSTMFRSGGKLPVSSPCRCRCPRFFASRKSVLSPRSGLCFLGQTSTICTLPSRMFFTGIQYDPVLSIATLVQPSWISHCLSFSSSGTVVPNIRVVTSPSFSAGPTTRATASSLLPISIPAHRSITAGISITYSAPLLRNEQPAYRRTLCLSGPYRHQSGVHIRQPDRVDKRVSYTPEGSSVFARPLPDSIPESPPFSLAGVARCSGPIESTIE